MLRKLFLFFCNADCTNNSYHFQALLALTTIFLIHQCVHFWGASTEKPGATKPPTFQFSNLTQVTIQNRQGNFKNVRICNGKLNETLAHVDGVLVVTCFRNNGGHVRPPLAGLNFTITVEIPRKESDQNGGITTLVEIIPTDGHGLDPNVTVTPTLTGNVILTTNLGPGTTLDYFV